MTSSGRISAILGLLQKSGFGQAYILTVFDFGRLLFQIILSVVKPAEEEADTMVVRAQDLDRASQTCQIEFFRPPATVMSARLDDSSLGELLPLANGAVPLNLTAKHIPTLKVHGRSP